MTKKEMLNQCCQSSSSQSEAALETAGSTGAGGQPLYRQLGESVCSFVHAARGFFIRHPVIFITRACIEGSFVTLKDHLLQCKHAGVDHTARKAAAALRGSRASCLRAKQNTDVKKKHLSWA